MWRRVLGTGSNHLRHKDGLWAVLFWLDDFLAAHNQSVEGLVRAHWRNFGRHYYTRHDYEDLDHPMADRLMSALRENLSHLKDRRFGSLQISLCDDFAYVDPVDQSLAEQQGIRIVFSDQARIIYRLSGTGTQGATLRVYLERFEQDPSRQGLPTQDALAHLAAIAEKIGRVQQTTGRSSPSLVT